MFCEGTIASTTLQKRLDFTTSIDLGSSVNCEANMHANVL